MLEQPRVQVALDQLTGALVGQPVRRGEVGPQIVVVQGVEHPGGPGGEGEHDRVTVGGREATGRQEADLGRGLPVGHPTGPPMPEQVGGPTVDAGRLGLEHREIDVGSQAGALGHGQGRHRSQGGQVAALIGDDVAGQLQRLAVAPACRAHRTGHGVGHDVLTEQIGVGSVLAERGHRGDDQGRVGGLELVDPEATLGQPPGRRRLDDQVGAVDQPAHHLLIAVAVEVGHHRALVGVEMEEQGALLDGGIGVGLDVIGERATGPGRVAPRWLDLDDVGPVRRQQLSGEGSGHTGGQLDHPDPVERATPIGPIVVHGPRQYRRSETTGKRVVRPG